MFRVSSGARLVTVLGGMGVILASAFLAQGCDELGPRGPRECTEMGCSDGLAMVFEPALTEAGAYEFDILVEGEEPNTCTATVPVEHGSLGCDGSLSVHVVPKGAGAIGEISLWSAPEGVELVVRHEGTEIRRATLTPEYTTLYPNGEECDADWGGCQQATVEINP